MKLAVMAALLLSVPAGTSAQQTTGVVKPGMTQDQVVAAWGQPVRAVTSGDYTYLFYDSGCCGLTDVVFLEHGQVVDALARGAHHTYDGISSLSPARKPGYTAPAR
ncbi:MAG TPA: hypothetical protein VMJ30_00145 [Gemmatimonadales bacterium]|nr:hypothetical protein [Gemmatimonadales bacterium]